MPNVYVRAWALGCSHSLISSQFFRGEGTDRVGGQPRGDKECPFSGVTKSGRVWGRCRKAVLGVWVIPPVCVSRFGLAVRR